MRTRNGTSNRLRFTRMIPLPITLLPDLFLVTNGSIIGAFEDSNASDGLLLDRLDFVPIETKGFFLLIIGCMTSACIWSPLAKIRRFICLSLSAFTILLRASWLHCFFKVVFCLGCVDAGQSGQLLWGLLTLQIVLEIATGIVSKRRILFTRNRIKERKLREHPTPGTRVFQPCVESVLRQTANKSFNFDCLVGLKLKTCLVELIL